MAARSRKKADPKADTKTEAPHGGKNIKKGDVVAPLDPNTPAGADTRRFTVPGLPILPEPYFPPLPTPEQERLQEQTDHAYDLAAATSKRAQKQREDTSVKDHEERQKHTVLVRATRRGFYPHDGKIRHVGDVFPYELHKGADGKRETSLPTWMEHVDGELPTRASDDLTGNEPDATTVLEIRGAAAGDVTVRPGAGARGRSVL